MKELTPFEGFQEHTLSLSVCFLLHKASLLSYSLSPRVLHCPLQPSYNQKGWWFGLWWQYPKCRLLTSLLQAAILLANIFLKLLSDMREMNFSEKTSGTYFPFLSGLPEWLQEGAETMWCTWFLRLLWGPNQECMEADENPLYFVSLTSYHHTSYCSRCTWSG